MTTRSARWALVAAAISLVVLSGATAAAGQTGEPTSILSDGDATDLAAALARATEVQGVCYGWQVTVTGAATAGSKGSNAGPGRSPGGEQCRSTVVFRAELNYTSDSSEAEDSASITVSAPTGGPTAEDLARLGITPAALLGDSATDTVFNGTAVLPMLMAEKGLAPVVPPRTETAIPGDAQVDESPGGDLMRTWGLPLLILAGIVLLGVVVLIWALLSKGRKGKGPSGEERPTTGPPAPPAVGGAPSGYGGVAQPPAPQPSPPQTPPPPGTGAPHYPTPPAPRPQPPTPPMPPQPA